ncbi:MAG: tRNA (adenosine(37)-N6)-threonylcarbamoyltransferase complex ATPase subunit type 1 TsaE [Maribacter sp.]|uniref:tRNA (adenosine(37)-N6)-threonylcarbamoyltransferase complex ATPase subunit type 1 TsaE n=1 Tax=Maribacter sp. TaxID=1897614 RepID=UPI003C761DBD
MEITYNESQLTEVANTLIQKAPSKIICFHGEMGAGKTTLIKAIVRQLGGVGEASSPTFGIVNEYHDQDEQVLAYHFDFYRLNDENEAFDLGIEDYFSTDVWIFMEWAEKVKSLLPFDTTEIVIKVVDKTTRTLLLPE